MREYILTALFCAEAILLIVACCKIVGALLSRDRGASGINYRQ